MVKGHRLLNHQPLLRGRGLPEKAQSFRRVSQVPPLPLPPTLHSGVLREANPLGDLTFTLLQGEKYPEK